MAEGVQRGIFHSLIQKTSSNFLKTSTHPHPLTAILSCFSSYHHLKLFHVICLLGHSLPVCPSMKTGTFSLSACWSQHLKLSLTPGKGAELLVEGREEKIQKEKCLLSTYYMLCAYKFISHAGAFIIGSAYFYIYRAQLSECLVTLFKVTQP